VRANPPAQSNKPNRLQLQVPERAGGSVRLATPPIVLVNGENDTSIPRNTILASAGDTISGKYLGSPRDQYSSLQSSGSSNSRQSEDIDHTNIDVVESHFISEILAADWYNAGGVSIDRCSLDEADKVCKHLVRSLRDESSSTEAFLINLSALTGRKTLTRHLRITRLEDSMAKSIYECNWKMKFGSLEGNFTIRSTVQHDTDCQAMDHGDHSEEDGTEASWKKKYLALQQQVRERDESVENLKKGVLDALVASNHPVR